MPASRRLCASLSLGLALVWGLWHGWLSPPPAAILTVSLLGILPLVALMPGVLAGNRTATGLLGFLALLYLAYGLMELVANPGARPLAVLGSLLSVALLVSAGHTLRRIPTSAGRVQGKPD
jgi:uncharacterized membrane protein